MLHDLSCYMDEEWVNENSNVKYSIFHENSMFNKVGKKKDGCGIRTPCWNLKLFESHIFEKYLYIKKSEKTLI